MQSLDDLPNSSLILAGMTIIIYLKIEEENNHLTLRPHFETKLTAFLEVLH